MLALALLKVSDRNIGIIIIIDVWHTIYTPTIENNVLV